MQVAAALAAEILKSGSGVTGLEAWDCRPGVDAKWISECAKDLRANAGKSLVVAGYRQPLAVHLLAHAMNAALGNIGQTVVLPRGSGVEGGRPGRAGAGAERREVETLVMLGGNPVYTAPADLDWATTQRKAKTRRAARLLRRRDFPGLRLAFPRGALSGILGRRPDQRRHAGADSAADRAAYSAA